MSKYSFIEILLTHVLSMKYQYGIVDKYFAILASVNESITTSFNTVL